jgi:hypothetical protein
MFILFLVHIIMPSLNYHDLNKVRFTLFEWLNVFGSC